MRTARRRWVFQNLGLPMLPWVLSLFVAPFILEHPEWQIFGITVYTISITLIAFFMGGTIARVNEIVPDEFDKDMIATRSQLWYLCGLAYVVIFTLYDVLELKDEVHHWFWGRAVDLAIMCLGGFTLLRAHLTCAAFKLHVRS